MTYDLLLPLITHARSLGPSYFWTTARRISSLLGVTVDLLAIVVVAYAILLAIVFVHRRRRTRPRETKRIE